LKVAFIGKAGCGKTTLSNHLVDSDKFIKLSFATPLKRIAEEILMRPIDKTDPLDRKFLQQLGTEIGRARQKDIWIKHFDKSLQFEMQMSEQGYNWSSNFVVDDCRFLNEAEYLKSNGFIIIKITGRQLDLGDNAKHASEVEQDQIKADCEINNNGTLEETIEILDNILGGNI